MRSTLVSRNVTICGRRTSLRLEIEMWNSISAICHQERLTVHQLCSLIEEVRLKGSSRTSAVRAFTVLYFRLASKVSHGEQVVIPGILPTLEAA